MFQIIIISLQIHWERNNRPKYTNWIWITFLLTLGLLLGFFFGWARLMVFSPSSKSNTHIFVWDLEIAILIGQCRKWKGMGQKWHGFFAPKMNYYYQNGTRESRRRADHHHGNNTTFITRIIIILSELLHVRLALLALQKQLGHWHAAQQENG